MPKSLLEPLGLTERVKTFLVALVIDMGHNIYIAKRQGNEGSNSFSFSNFLFD